MPDYDVVVIGAGCGGMTAGALLAKQGRKVLVLEQSSRVGGCCSTYEHEGYRFDVGATILEIIDPIETAFEMLETTFRDEVELEPCDPVYNVIFEDGSRLTYPSSVEAKAEIISRISPEDGKSWLEYARYFHGFLETVMKGFYVSPANNMTDMTRMLAKDPRLLKYFPLFGKNFEDVIRKYFKNERVQQSIYYPGFFCGLPRPGPGDVRFPLLLGARGGVVSQGRDDQDTGGAAAVRRALRPGGAHGPAGG